ncbi:MAG: hypothetical protein ACTS47_02970 [Candidatus Hodgkinia cicadicola]
MKSQYHLQKFNLWQFRIFFCNFVLESVGSYITYSDYEVYALKKEEGGRHTPFFSSYKPQFFFRTADAYRFDDWLEAN